jgi:hypothetical protein
MNGIGNTCAKIFMEASILYAIHSKFLPSTSTALEILGKVVEILNSCEVLLMLYLPKFDHYQECKDRAEQVTKYHC